VFGKLPNGVWLQWSPSILLEDNGPSFNDNDASSKSKVLADGGGNTMIQTGNKAKCSNTRRSMFNEGTCRLSTVSDVLPFIFLYLSIHYILCSISLLFSSIVKHGMLSCSDYRRSID